MLLLGLAVGVISTGLGIGGGIVMVPAFMLFVPGMDAHTAKGTSLFIIIFVSLVNVWRLGHRGEQKPWELAAILAAGSVVGGYLGAWLTQFVTESQLTWIFVIVVMGLGFRSIFVETRKPAPRDVPQSRRYTAGPAIGVATGLVSGASGIGGGLILVPLALQTGIARNERVVLLSNMVMVATAVAATVAHLMAAKTLPEDAYQSDFTIGQVNLALAPLVFLGAQIGAPFGKAINMRLTLPQRQLAMGVLLLVIALRLSYRALGS